MDVIQIRGLRVEAHVGVTEEERARPQEIAIGLELSVDTRSAGESDDLTDTVDYGAVAMAVASLARRERPRLLEALAARIVAEIEAIPEVLGVTVEVVKVNPPIPENLEGVGVKIERTFSR